MKESPQLARGAIRHSYVQQMSPRPAASWSLTAVETTTMERAIELAVRGAGTALPNTVVGCVLLSAAGRVVGEWFHGFTSAPAARTPK